MKALSGQSIFDIALQTSGSVESAFELALLNDMGITDEPAGMEMKAPAVFNKQITAYYHEKQIFPATFNAQSVTLSALPVTFTTETVGTVEKQFVMSGQTLFDMAIQTSGSVEAAFELSLLNSLGITDDLTPGILLKETSVVNKQILSYYQNKNIRPATQIVISTLATENGIFDYTFNFTFN